MYVHIQGLIDKKLMERANIKVNSLAKNEDKNEIVITSPPEVLT